MSLLGRRDDTGESPAGPGEELRSSARGWHGAQLAVLGFIGLCGVLQSDAGGENPRWLEVVAGFLVLGALATAVLGTALVASVAWPVAAPDDSRLPSARRRVYSGVGLTYTAVVLMALGATSAWWPHQAPVELVQVRTSGGTACGELVASSQDGALTLLVSGRSVSVASGSVLGVTPVDAC